MEILIVLASILAYTTATPGLLFPGQLGPSGIMPGPGIGLDPFAFAGGPIGPGPAMAPLSPIGPILPAGPAFIPSPGIGTGAPALSYDYASIGAAPAFISDPGIGGSGLSFSAPLSIGAIDRGGLMYSPPLSLGATDRGGVMFSPISASAIDRTGAVYSPGVYSYGPVAGLTSGSAYPGVYSPGFSSGIIRGAGGSGAFLSRGGSAVGTDLSGFTGSAANLGTIRRTGGSIIGENISGLGRVTSGGRLGTANSAGGGIRGDIMSGSGANSISERSSLRAGGGADIGAGGTFNSLGLNTLGPAGSSDIISSGGRNGFISERSSLRVGGGVDMGAEGSFNSIGLNTLGSVRRNDFISGLRTGGDFTSGGGSSLNGLGLNTLGSASAGDIMSGSRANSIGFSSSLNGIGLNTLGGSGGSVNSLGIAERRSLRVGSDALSAGGGLNGLGIDVTSGGGSSLDVGAMRNGITGGALSTGMGPSAVSGPDLSLTETGSSFSGSVAADSGGLLNTAGLSERAGVRIGSLPDGISGGGATADIGAATALHTSSGSSTGQGLDLVDPLASSMNAIAGTETSQPIGPGLTAEAQGGSFDPALSMSGGDRLSGMSGGSSVVDRMQFTNSGPLRNTDFLSGGTGIEAVGITGSAQGDALRSIGLPESAGALNTIGTSRGGMDPAGPL